MIFWGG